MSVSFGDGRDGNLTVLSGTFNINTDPSGSRSYADGIAYKVTSNPTTIFITIGISPNGIDIGDKVLLISLQGSTSDYDDVGNWEVFDVIDIQPTFVQVDRVPSKSYDGTSWANQKVVMQRIPQYENVTVSGTGEIIASTWDRLSTTPAGSAGYRTATISMFVNDTLTNYNDINVAQKGYYGGQSGVDGSSAYGWPGESTGRINTSRDTDGTAKPEGGGAAAYYPGSGGAGGGHGTAGANGTPNADVSGMTFYGGEAFGDEELYRMNFGGGGGGAGEGPNGRTGVGGGAGGGIVYIHARSMYSYGSITANGQNGPNGVKIYDHNSGGGGGGGAGGTIYIKTYDIWGIGSSITAIKGTGGLRDASAAGSKNGGNGGEGLVRIDYTRANGANWPNDSVINSIIDPDPYDARLPYGWYYFSGYTKFLYDVPASGVQLYVYRRDTGAYMGNTTSSGNGAFEITTTYSGEHFLVSLDTPIDGNYNDLVIGKVIPAYQT